MKTAFIFMLIFMAGASVSNAGTLSTLRTNVETLAARDATIAEDTGTLVSRFGNVATATAALRVSIGTIAFSHAHGFNSTLGQNTTFSAFVPTRAITLRRVTATIVVAGIGGAGDRWYCGSDGAQISVITAAGAAAGTVQSSATVTANIAAGTTVYMWLNSAAATTPTGNVSVEY